MTPRFPNAWRATYRCCSKTSRPAWQSFQDNTFDTVLCLSALQMMKNVEGILRDIARVGREAIVSFPNFAYWPHRVALLRGRMPVSKSLPYEWYDTPNLRCATIKDFEALASDVGLEVLECIALDRRQAGDGVAELARQPGGVPAQEKQAGLMTPIAPQSVQEKLTWHSYLNRRMLILVFLGFSSGLPLFISAQSDAGLAGQVRASTSRRSA